MITQDQIKELEKKVEELSIFHQVGKALTSTLDLQEVLTLIMGKISELLKPSTWSLLLIDEKKQELHFQIAIGKNSTQIKDVRIRIGKGLVGWVAQTGEVAIINDVSEDPRFLPEIDGIIHPHIKSIVCVPLKSKERTLGVIELINCFEGTFPNEDLSMLTSLADYAAIAIENAMYVKRIQELTITDDCTNLYNSRYFNYMIDAELSRSKRYSYNFALIFFDLDRFKLVNDTHGHLCGSRLLREIGDLIKQHLRDIDTAYRYGGDEFILLLPQTSKENALLVAKRLCSLLNQTSINLEDHVTVKITASFGVAAFPVDAATKVELVRLADQAMYRVKNRTRNDVGAT
ncbi:MAG: sensor domain-containing diguanylate cyclase [Acidobacteria bacterium]|nr:MAG: sensor domain-containing diguanylate cyclase [Acidobacteriota bacterium]